MDRAHLAATLLLALTTGLSITQGWASFDSNCNPAADQNGSIIKRVEALAGVPQARFVANEATWFHARDPFIYEDRGSLVANAFDYKFDPFTLGPKDEIRIFSKENGELKNAIDHLKTNGITIEYPKAFKPATLPNQFESYVDINTDANSRLKAVVPELRKQLEAKLGYANLQISYLNYLGEGLSTEKVYRVKASGLVKGKLKQKALVARIGNPVFPPEEGTNNSYQHLAARLYLRDSATLEYVQSHRILDSKNRVYVDTVTNIAESQDQLITIREMASGKNGEVAKSAADLAELYVKYQSAALKSKKAEIMKIFNSLSFKDDAEVLTHLKNIAMVSRSLNDGALGMQTHFGLSNIRNKLSDPKNLATVGIDFNHGRNVCWVYEPNGDYWHWRYIDP